MKWPRPPKYVVFYRLPGKPWRRLKHLRPYKGIDEVKAAVERLQELERSRGVFEFTWRSS